MIDYQKYINALRKCAKEHENDRTFTGYIIVTDLCRDTANLLEELWKESSRDMEEIKAEISEEICLTDNPYTKETKYTIDHLKLLEILDKHRQKTESDWVRNEDSN